MPDWYGVMVNSEGQIGRYHRIYDAIEEVSNKPMSL